MDLFSKLFGRKPDDVNVTEETEVKPNKPSASEVFKSPSLLADWVIKYTVHIFSVEDDFRHAPDDEIRDDLNITYEQVERLAREESILRAAGASYCIKLYYDDQFYLKYFSKLYTPVAEHIYGEPTKEQIIDTRDALEVYISSIADEEDEDLKAFSTQYMRRIYDDNDNYFKMKFAGIPSLAIDSSLTIFEAVCDACCRVTQGMPYESAVKLAEALEQVKSENA